MLLRVVFALLCLGVLCLNPGCDTEADPPVDLGDFTANFTDFDPHIGQNFYLKVKEASTGETVGTVSPLEVTQADFTVSLPKVIETGTVYNVDFWADVDDNGIADRSPTGTPAGVDHTWRKTLTGTGTGLNLTFVHDTVWTDITPF